MTRKNIVLVGTFDTKGAEFTYVKNLLEEGDYTVTLVDTGTGARGELLFQPDYSREQVAKAAGTSMRRIVSLGERAQENRIIGIMARGATKICLQLYEAGRLDGILSLGGTLGTNLGTTVMRALPLGIPKVMLSTIASGDTYPYIGTKDIVMVPSIADIAGLNRITKMSLARAAGALMGMLATGGLESSKKPLIGITTLGSTMPCALAFKKRIEEMGYEGVIFHSIGIGGRTMEELIEQGLIQGVFDLSTNEVVDHLYGGWADAGPRRMEMAGSKGIAQLVAPGNIDYMLYTSAEKIPDQFKQQPFHLHGPTIYILRTKKKAIMKVAEVMAKKLNKSRGPTAIIFPLKGFSALDKLKKEIFFDPEANLAYLKVLKTKLRADIPIRQVDAHINDSLFAEEAVQMFSELMQARQEEANLLH